MYKRQGDHRVTALAIARELDIYREGSTVISGDELETMTEEELDRAVQTAAVFARVSPAEMCIRDSRAGCRSGCPVWRGRRLSGKTCY